MEGHPKKCLYHAAEPVKWLTLGHPIKQYEDITEFTRGDVMG